MTTVIVLTFIVALVFIFYSTWKYINKLATIKQEDVAFKPTIKVPLTDVVPPVKDTTTPVAKKSRKPRKPKITGDK